MRERSFLSGASLRACNERNILERSSGIVRDIQRTRDHNLDDAEKGKERDMYSVIG